MDDNAEQPGLQRAASLGLKIAGAGVGAFAAAFVGDPVADALSAMAGTTIGEVGSDLVARMVSPRQTARVGAVFVLAGAAIKAKEVMGKNIRDDGFWAGEHSDGSEFAEGVILAAMDSFEERKIAHLANLLANVAVDANVDAASANYSLRLTERLSWLELCILGIVSRPNELPLPARQISESPNLFRNTVRRSWIDLIEEHKILADVQEHGSLRFNENMNSKIWTHEGHLVARLLQVEDIPRSDLLPIHAALAADGLEDI